MIKSKVTAAFIAIAAIIGFTCWEAGKSYGRQQESKVIDLARNMQAYETEWVALYHMSLLDYDAALLQQKQKFINALDRITNYDTDGIDPNLRWYYVDRIVQQHPSKLNELPSFNDIRNELIKKKSEAQHQE